MTAKINDRERTTQNNLIRYFQKTLKYTYLGDWQHRDDNKNVEDELLKDWLKKQDWSDNVITQTLTIVKRAAEDISDDLYTKNKKFYNLLRYPIQIMDADISRKHRDVWLIDWENPENNDFAIAEEVTIHGKTNNRPDIVIYINGIAVGIIELKRSSVHLSEGIRQSIGNQGSEYIRDFFTTNQILFSGNETEGARYGVIGSPEKYYMKWAEEEDISDDLSVQIRDLRSKTDSFLEQDITSLCQKDRLLDILKNFILFDAGIKKTCRHNQYFAIKNTPAHIKEHGGGIIWHTQGSGKSITMVWLARILSESEPDARILIITDRAELDKQIKNTFKDTGENNIVRATSGAKLIELLKDNSKRIICSLIHKFGKQNDDYSEYLEELHTVGFSKLQGKFYVFIDECHRTQSGDLHAAMKRILPNAVIIGFTGTPLLKSDHIKRKSIDIFGGYIHKYTYDQGVKDHVILDLVYEGRDIEQNLTSPEKVDEWFENKTKGLTDEGKYILKKRWGTIQKLYSSKERLNKIVGDILIDMDKIPRLSNGCGNAMLVAGSIYQACKYYNLFQDTELAGKCAVLSSYDPNNINLKLEQSGERISEEEYKAKTHNEMWGNKTPEEFEESTLDKFLNEPARMKLLIVVDRFLTGFDAPKATYLYIDKHMQDHGLFQAICRVNRLDTDDKEHGYIIDYKQLFQCLANSIHDYTSGAFENYLKADIENILIDRLKKAHEIFLERIKQLDELCEPLYPSKELPKFIKFFCNINSADIDEFEENKIKRQTLYKLTSSLARAYSEISGSFPELGYRHDEEIELRKKTEWYIALRKEISIASGDAPDLKRYDPAMRDLIDRFVSADESKTIAKFEDTSILEMIEAGEDILDLLGGKDKNVKSAAETVIRNISRHITVKKDLNPKYFEKISSILNELIRDMKQNSISNEELLKRLIDLTSKALHPEKDEAYPLSVRKREGLRAIYDFVEHDEELTLKIAKVVEEEGFDNWRGDSIKERRIQKVLYEIFDNVDKMRELFQIIKQNNEF